MTTLFAQPYDISAHGFYFDSFDDYAQKSATLRNDYGDPVEEFEIQFIDGDDIDCVLASAWSLHQGGISTFFDAVSDWDDHQKITFIIAVGECGYAFDPASGHPDDFEVDIYEMDSLTALAESFVDEGLYGDIPEILAFYIDYEAIARDLSVDFSETVIAGKRLIYACR
jgi:antirestriction protein